MKKVIYYRTWLYISLKWHHRRIFLVFFFSFTYFSDGEPAIIFMRGWGIEVIAAHKLMACNCSCERPTNMQLWLHMKKTIEKRKSIKQRKETKNKIIHMNLRVESYDREVEWDLHKKSIDHVTGQFVSGENGEASQSNRPGRATNRCTTNPC